MYRQKPAGWWMIAALLLSVTAMFIAGCDSKSVQDDTSDDTQVIISASPSIVATAATSIIEVTVTAAGTGLADQVVAFAVEPTDAGTFSPTSDVTDASGVAATVFTGTTAGSATITATIPGTDYSASINVTVSEPSPSGSGNVNLSVSPSLLLANGNDTAMVTIAVRDALGQPAPDGTLVKIVAGEKFEDVDGNGYWSAGIDSLVYDVNSNGQWDAIGLVPSTASVSGGDGMVEVDYIAGSNAQTIYIKVTVDENGIQGSAEMPIQLTPNASIHSIYLYSDSINLVVAQTGGIETSLLHAVGYDVYGNSVPEGLNIRFVITDGPDGGEYLGTAGVDSASAVTSSMGVATVPIHSGTASGTIRIRAQSDTILSNATQIMVSAGPPAHIVVGAEECNVPYWDNVAEEVGIVAVISDIYNNPVNDSTVAYFTTDEGTMKSHEARTMELEGTVSTIWISGNNVATADGRVYIYAETAGGTVADTSMFFNTHYPDTLIVTGVPASMLADGKTKATVMVDALDLNDNPVVGGTKFKADANYLLVEGGTLENGCYGASAMVKITSATLDVDNSLTGANDDGIGAHDNVIYYSGGTAASYFTVALTTGFAYSGNSSITSVSTATLGESVSISATIRDRFGNPLGDHTLNMTASAGSVSGATQETNGYGEANGFVWTAPGAATSVTITISDTDPRGGIFLTTTINVE